MNKNNARSEKLGRFKARSSSTNGGCYRAGKDDCPLENGRKPGSGARYGSGSSASSYEYRRAEYE
ncbi:MAG: hypothetical protein AAF745_13275, partial [Planctomycetota bacterium]